MPALEICSSDESFLPFRPNMDGRNTGNQGMTGPSIQFLCN